MEYVKRIIDETINKKSLAFNAINIVGPKGCGKIRNLLTKTREKQGRNEDNCKQKWEKLGNFRNISQFFHLYFVPSPPQ